MIHKHMEVLLMCTTQTKKSLVLQEKKKLVHEKATEKAVSLSLGALG